jgi:Sec-independent protein translocase protein TatA
MLPRLGRRVAATLIGVRSAARELADTVGNEDGEEPEASERDPDSGGSKER